MFSNDPFSDCAALKPDHRSCLSFENTKAWQWRLWSRRLDEILMTMNARLRLNQLSSCFNLSYFGLCSNETAFMHSDYFYNNFNANFVILGVIQCYHFPKFSFWYLLASSFTSSIGLINLYSLRFQPSSCLCFKRLCEVYIAWALWH